MTIGFARNASFFAGLGFSCRRNPENPRVLTSWTNRQSHTGRRPSDDDYRWLTMCAAGGFGRFSNRQKGTEFADKSLLTWVTKLGRSHTSLGVARNTLDRLTVAQTIQLGADQVEISRPLCSRLLSQSKFLNVRKSNDRNGPSEENISIISVLMHILPPTCAVLPTFITNDRPRRGS